MEYVTVRQAAQKWKISQRLIQQYCNDGRIDGAIKFSGCWAIPADAPRPDNLRKAKKQTVYDENAETTKKPDITISHLTPMPLMNAAFLPGHCLEYIQNIKDPKLKDIAMAEYYYFSGQPEKASKITQRYLTSPDISLQLSACLIYAYANLSIGVIQEVQHALIQVQHTLDNISDDIPEQLMASAIFIAATSATLLHLPLPEKAKNLQENIRILPPGLKMFALYVQAHRTYLQGDYRKSIGIVETAFAMQMQLFPIPAIYMHLVAVMDYMSLKQPEMAHAHLLYAWKIAQPDDLIEGFGEHHGLLCGMLEAVIKKDYPEDFKRIIAITYRFSAGWRIIHNSVTGDEVADNLTTTEFTTAMLAARGWTNKEIAKHLGVSANTVKEYISNTLQKLNIQNRKELKKFMLR